MLSPASLFMNRKLVMALLAATPVLAYLAPAHCAIVFTAFLVWVALSSKSMAGELDDIPGRIRPYYKRMFGMLCVVGVAFAVIALVTYTRVRAEVVSPSAGPEQLAGVYDGYRAFRMGYLVVITVFLIIYGYSQSLMTLTSTDSLELTKMQHLESLWLGADASGIVMQLASMWSVSLILMAVAPTTVAKVLPDLLSTISTIRGAAAPGL